MQKHLRKRSTEAEKFLWHHLRLKQLEGLKFRRQQSIGNYIVDFVCFEKRIIVEVDGGQHIMDEEKEKDNKRDKWLGEQGFKVLRFWNNDIFTNINGILEVIRDNCLNHPPLTSCHRQIRHVVGWTSRRGRGIIFLWQKLRLTILELRI